MERRKKVDFIGHMPPKSLIPHQLFWGTKRENADINISSKPELKTRGYNTEKWYYNKNISGNAEFAEEIVNFHFKPTPHPTQHGFSSPPSSFFSVINILYFVKNLLHL